MQARLFQLLVACALVSAVLAHVPATSGGEKGGGVATRMTGQSMSMSSMQGGESGSMSSGRYVMRADVH